LFLLSNILFFSLFSSLTSASDLAKEKRWSEQIVDSLMVGDSVWLESGKSKFLGLFSESNLPKTKGAIIVAHGIGVHPNWPDVVQPIRSEMVEHGWATLSIQLPILENGKTSIDYLPLFKDVNGRFAASVNYLKNKNINNIIIVAHSLGTAMAGEYLAKRPDATVRAYIAISQPNNPDYPELNNTKKLASIKTIPVLDLYGSQDLDDVLHFANDRKVAGTKNNSRYSQKIINGANHFFQSSNAELIKTIRLWLDKNAPSTEVKISK